ncbi:hypothetical protein ACFS5M_07090 [Lacinutrix iliipiscaria]|uniref:Uncharacterized protein n=1 Tax=Lacinutrix iliipiscaria TaxID=1230532 RepID=A0ABW5WNH3_9FLAO
MKKVIVLFVVCCLSHLSFAQDLTRLEHSDIANRQFIETNNLKDFSRLATSADVGVAYIKQNQVKTYNKEKGIQLVRIKSNDLNYLDTNLNFASTIEMIVISISKPGFDIQSIDCSKFNQFKNLKYIYFVFQSNLIENKKLPKLNCVTDDIKQYYSNNRPI